MPRHVRMFLMIAGSSLMTAVARAQSVPDAIEVVVKSGPHAGTYKVPDTGSCGHYTGSKMFFATWRSFEDPEPGKISSAAIKVSNPDQAGPKHGDVQVSFADKPGEKVVPDYKATDVPVTLTIKGKGAEISFDGKTKEGIGLSVKATCSKVETWPN